MRADAEKTERALRQLAGLLDEWSGAQRSWLWLDCIFAGKHPRNLLSCEPQSCWKLLANTCGTDSRGPSYSHVMLLQPRTSSATCRTRQRPLRLLIASCALQTGLPARTPMRCTLPWRRACCSPCNATMARWRRLAETWRYGTCLHAHRHVLHTKLKYAAWPHS